MWAPTRGGNIFHDFLITTVWKAVNQCFVCCLIISHAGAHLHVFPAFLIKVPLSLEQDKDKEESNAEKSCDLLGVFSGQPDRK